MKRLHRNLVIALIATAPLAAFAQVYGGNGVARCTVTDMEAFDTFIEGKPTVSDFRAAYSCVHLVLPGDMVTRDLRWDNSRYFPIMDEFGRITGGSFR